MFQLLDVKQYSSHAARDKAWDHFNRGYPGGAIDLFRKVGMDECEIMLPTSFRIYSEEDKLRAIDHCQKQARTRIKITRTVLRNREPVSTPRQMAQTIHEDEGVIMGLERLKCLIAKILPDYTWESVIDGETI